MTTPIQNQNLNKCPHGFPVGTCPICSGMGSSTSRDKNKPRIKGEMSYNECMAVWIKMQEAKQAKIQAAIDRVQNAKESLLQNRVIFGLDKITKSINKIIQNFENFPKPVRLPLKIAFQVLDKVISIVKNTVIFVLNFNVSIQSISEKLSSLLGEIKNFISSIIDKKFKKTLKTLLSLFMEFEQSEEEDVEKGKFEKIKRVIKALFKDKKEKENESLVS